MYLLQSKDEFVPGIRKCSLHTGSNLKEDSRRSFLQSLWGVKPLIEDPSSSPLYIYVHVYSIKMCS